MKKGLGLILIVVMMLFSLTNKVEGMTGSGTVDDPFVIWDVNDLQAVEGGVEAYYELGGNIDASATSGWNEEDGSGVFEGFLSIGYKEGEPFVGRFDGKGYTISDLFINRPDRTHQALFCWTYATDPTVPTIKNVNMTGVDITSGDYVAALVGYTDRLSAIDNCSVAGTVKGNDRVGGLVGHHEGGPITNCNSSCAVTGVNAVGNLVGLSDYFAGPIEDCYATGVVNATNYAGGFIGLSVDDITISKCYATGAVTVTGDYGGGFIGSDQAEQIDQCYATGNVVVGGDYGGGFVGVTQGIITNCYSRGDVDVTGDYSGGFAGMCSYPPGGSGYIGKSYSTGAPTSGNGNLGGFCGNIGGDGEIEDCFWDKQTSGLSLSDGGTGLTTLEMFDDDVFLAAGWDGVNIWELGGGDYPYLQAGTPGSPIPEPSVLLLFGIGVLGAGVFRRNLAKE